MSRDGKRPDVRRTTYPVRPVRRFRCRVRAANSPVTGVVVTVPRLPVPDALASDHAEMSRKT